VVEDAGAGIEGARRAGMRSVGVGGAATATATISVHSLDRLPSDAFERLVSRA
jgi:beta-phosphoglucomutase-like phosphatase (HAD superfamily)